MVGAGPGARVHVLGLRDPRRTILEAYGALFDKNFHILLIGTWGALGFIENSSPSPCSPA
jgi:hypothetical protein